MRSTRARPPDFVAAFIGETNMFEGTVESVEGNMVAVDVAGLGRILVTEDEPPRPGTRAAWSYGRKRSA